MNYNTILFDLDGTLTDPAEGITKSLSYALEQFDIREQGREKLCGFIGAPLREIFSDHYGFSDEDTEKAVDYYRDYFAPRGLYENSVYDGIENLLKMLRDDGRTLLVATLKPQVFAVRVLKHFGLESYFDFISGPELDGTRGHKNDVIDYAFASSASADRRAAVMVGDRAPDMRAAKDAGFDSIGVLYGYGTREELTEAGAVRLAETVGELKTILTDG